MLNYMQEVEKIFVLPDCGNGAIRSNWLSRYLTRE